VTLRIRRCPGCPRTDDGEHPSGVAGPRVPRRCRPWLAVGCAGAAVRPKGDPKPLAVSGTRLAHYCTFKAIVVRCQLIQCGGWVTLGGGTAHDVDNLSKRLWDAEAPAGPPPGPTLHELAHRSRLRVPHRVDGEWCGIRRQESNSSAGTGLCAAPGSCRARGHCHHLTVVEHHDRSESTSASSTWWVTTSASRSHSRAHSWAQLGARPTSTAESGSSGSSNGQLKRMLVDELRDIQHHERRQPSSGT